MSQKGKIIDPEFAALVEQSRKNQEKSKKRQPPPRISLVGITDLTGPPVVNFNSKCGCYGTKHDVVNNCLGCGRVICTMEGERPCPFCGELVLSNETLNDPERFERVVGELRERIGREQWKPIREQSLEVAEVSREVSTAMIDVERDYFDAELLGLFAGPPDDE
jgi:hypothetical protein